jgi:hypothetical protein
MPSGLPLRPEGNPLRDPRESDMMTLLGDNRAPECPEVECLSGLLNRMGDKGFVPNRRGCFAVLLAVVVLAVAMAVCGRNPSNQVKADVIFRFGWDQPLTSWPSPDGSVASIIEDAGHYVIERRDSQGDVVASTPIEMPQVPARVECLGNLPDGRGFLLCTAKTAFGEKPKMAAQWVAWSAPETNAPEPWVPFWCWPEESAAAGVVWEQWRNLAKKGTADGFVGPEKLGGLSCVLIGNPGNGAEQWHHVVDGEGHHTPHRVSKWGDDSLFVGGCFTGTLLLDGKPLLTGPDRSSWGETDMKVFILRVSQDDGKLLWAREIGPLGFSSDGNYMTCLTPRGTVVLVSFYRGPVTFDLKDGSRGVVKGGWLAVEIDQDGDYLWAQELAANCAVWFDRLTVLPDGSLVVRGEIGGGTAEGTMPNRDGHQVKMGNSRFLAVFEAPASERAAKEAAK